MRMNVILLKMLQNKKRLAWHKSFFGGDEGDRTLDLCVANAALSQLSHAPISVY